MDNPLLCFGMVKISLGLCELDQKRLCVVCMRLVEMNGLICVEMDRLMHELCVLAGCYNYIEYNCECRPLEME